MAALVDTLWTCAAWGSAHPHMMLGLAGGTLLLGLLGALLRQRHQRGGTSHGSARWATAQEVKEVGLYARQGVVVGMLNNQVLQSATGHVLLCGPTGSGKDRTTNFPTTKRYPHSMVIVDCKDGGENYQECAAHRPGKVYRFAPTLPGSHRLNLLAHIDPNVSSAFRECAVIAESLLSPKKRGERPSDSGEFFRQQAASVLRDVMLHILHLGGEASLPRVLHLMLMPEALLRSMCHGATPQIQATGDRLLDMYTTATRQFSGIWETALLALDVFKDPVIAEATRTSDFALTDLQFSRDPVTLYLGANAPTELGYLAPLFRAVLQSTLHQLMTRTGARRELLWLLNEFPALGYMAPLEQALPVVRSSRMRCLITIQDLGQLWDVYGQNTPLWGNCNVKIFHGPDNDLTAKRMSDMLGQSTVESAGESRQGGWGRQTRSTHESGRPLLTPAEVLGMPKDLAIVWAEGCPAPVLVRKCWT